MGRELTIEKLLSILNMHNTSIFGHILSEELEEKRLVFNNNKYGVRYINKGLCYKYTNKDSYKINSIDDLNGLKETLEKHNTITLFVNRVYFSKKQCLEYSLPSEVYVCAVISKDKVELTIKDDNSNILKVDNRLSEFLKYKLEFDTIQYNIELILENSNNIIGCTTLEKEEYVPSTMLIDYRENMRYIPEELIITGCDKNYGYLKRYKLNRKYINLNIKNYNGVVKTNKIFSMQSVIEKMTKDTIEQIDKGNTIALFVDYYNLPEISTESEIRVYIIISNKEIKYTVADFDNEILVTDRFYNKIIGRNILTNRVRHA